jgi:hypothetical protein
MAIYNEILAGRYNRFFQKLFGLKGGPPVPQLAGEVSPAFPLFTGVENRYLEAWDRFGVGITQPGVAAVLSTIKLRNPSGSNVIAIFEKISLSLTSADQVDLQAGTSQTDGATIVPVIAANNLDSRSGRPSTLILSASGAGAPVGQQAIWRTSIGAAVNVDIIIDENQEITLLPGRSIQLVAGVANNGLVSGWMWRERLLEESERS